MERIGAHLWLIYFRISAQARKSVLACEFPDFFGVALDSIYCALASPTPAHAISIRPVLINYLNF